MNMKTLPVRSALVVLLLTAWAASAQPSEAEQKRITRAKALVDALLEEDYAAAGKDFDEAMKKALPEAKLREVRTKLLDDFGPFGKHVAARTEVVEQFGPHLAQLRFRQG